MPRLFAVTVAVLAIAIASPAAIAQSHGSVAPTLVAGTRIRVTAAPPVTGLTGVVVSHTAETLAFRADDHGNTISVPVVQVTRLDVSGGRKTRKLLGASVGLAVGAGLGALVGQSKAEKANCTGSSVCGDAFVAAGGAVVGGLGGLILGTMLGAWSTERWTPVASTVIARASVGLAPAPGTRVALTTSITF